LCPLMWGAQEKSEGAHQKNFGRRFAPALCPPLANCFRRHWP